MNSLQSLTANIFNNDYKTNYRNNEFIILKNDEVKCEQF